MADEPGGGHVGGLGRDSRLKRYDDVRDMIGDIENPTPLVALRRMLAGEDVTLYVKLEWMNPFGSVKDRAAKWMLEGLDRRGELAPTVLEPTSGNTGIALAAIAALMDRHMIATVPHDLSIEKEALLRMLGAEIVHTTPDPSRHAMDVAISLAEDMCAADPSLVMPDQYDNHDNSCAHYQSTGPEIWAQTDGKIDYFFAGIGTGGTVTGVGRYLKEQNPDIRVIAIEPVPGHHISGLKNLEETAEPTVLDRSVLDEIIYVDDVMTRAMMRRAYHEDALMIGSSSAAILAGAIPWLRGKRGVAVAISPDSGQKAASYLAQVVESED